MISDFIMLNMVQFSEKSVIYSCCLPDPCLFTAEAMLVCGSIEYQRNTNKPDATGTIRIKLNDNFCQLCSGEIYQRKQFVQTVMFILEYRYGLCVQNANIELNDCWGHCCGKLESIDDLNREVD